MTSGDFVPDPSWPSILELAIEAWGQPNWAQSTHDDIRWGNEGSRHVTPSTNTFNIFEPGGGPGGGYLAMWKLAKGDKPLPPRTGVPRPGAGPGPRPNGAARPMPTGHGDGKKNPPWENVSDRVYSYRAADGRLVLQVFRTITGVPRFSQRCPNGTLRNGEIKWRYKVQHIPNHDTLLYRFPELLASGDAVIWIAEGEKDVDNLAALGLTTTTCIGGSGKWRAEYNQHFAGRDVVILPDFDPQSTHPKTGEPQWHPDGRPVLVGQDHADHVARSLTGIARSVRVLMLPDLPPKGDVSDWLAAGGTLVELNRLAREVPEYTLPPERASAKPDPADDRNAQEQDLSDAEPEPEPEPERLAEAAEQYGPPTLADLTVDDLAGMDEIAFGRIAKAKAALMEGLTPTALNRLVERKRNAAKAAAKAQAGEAKKKAKADAKEKATRRPSLTEAEFNAEIERLAKLSDAAFYTERPAVALRLGVSGTELTELVRRAKVEYARAHATIPPFVTEQDVLRAFVTQFSDDLRFNHSSGNWLVWTEHFWRPDQRKLAFYWALELCKQMTPANSAEGRAVVEKVGFSNAVERGARVVPAVSTAQDDWDNDHWALGTPGGVVDLKTGTLRPGQRGDMITKVTAVTPAATEDCPLWLSFLHDALDGDTKMIGFLKRYFGYCLTGLTMEEIIVFLFGPGGSGKGTVVKTITGIVGDYAITAPMEVFTAQAFRSGEYYRADMAGKRLIVAAETEQGAYWAEAFIKEITGGDRLSGRHPAGRPFTFDPTHKPLLHGNHMPKLRGRSTAMERRLRIALFNHKPAEPDPRLKDKLQAEWPGILRWMINGCLEWQRDGLQAPPAVANANKGYFDAQDVMGRWAEDCCILDKTLEETPSALRASFNVWARANDEEEMNGNAFAAAIDAFEGAPLKRLKNTADKRMIRGIGLKVTPKQREQQGARYGECDQC